MGEVLDIRRRCGTLIDHRPRIEAVMSANVFQSHNAMEYGGFSTDSNGRARPAPHWDASLGMMRPLRDEFWSGFVGGFAVGAVVVFWIMAARWAL